jgi:hypothetical protein
LPARSICHVPKPVQTLSQYRAGNFKAYAVLTEKRWFAAPDCADHRRRRRAGRALPVLARAVGAERHAEGCHRQAQRRRWSTRSPIRPVRQRLTEFGHEVAPRNMQTPEGLYATHKADVEKWGPIIKAANIKLQ